MKIFLKLGCWQIFINIFKLTAKPKGIKTVAVEMTKFSSWRFDFEWEKKSPIQSAGL